MGACIGEPQLAAVVLDHSSTDGEPQSHTSRFRCKKRIEYAISVLGGYSRPGSSWMFSETVESPSKPVINRSCLLLELRCIASIAFLTKFKITSWICVRLACICGRFFLKFGYDRYIANLQVVFH